jgi:hypothetical protein
MTHRRLPAGVGRAIEALRAMAVRERRKAAAGVTVIAGPPMIVKTTSNAAQSIAISRELDQLADQLSGGAP